MMFRQLPQLMLLALVAFPPFFGPAAQENEEGIPGLRVDPDLLLEDETEPKVVDDKDEGATPAQRDRMRRVNLEILARYPGRAAVTLLEELVARGEGSSSFLVECLKEPNVKVRMAAVHGLRELRDVSTFAALEAAAAESRNAVRLQTIADAMVGVDRERGLTAVAAYLESRRPIVRRHARDALLTHLRVDEAEATLSSYLESRKAEARQFALEILVRLLTVPTMSLCFTALRDEAPGVSYAAATALARHADEADIKQLQQLVNDSGLRSGPYAILALVMAEDVRGDRLFDDENAETVTRTFHSDDLLERGAAAIGMTNLASWRDDPSFLQLLDRRVVPVLIDTVSSTTYYPDHHVLRDLVLRKLVTLTGKNLGFDWTAWREWWFEARHNFEAQRGLSSPANIDADGATIRWLATGQRGQPVDLLVSSTFRLEDDGSPHAGEVVRLSRADMGVLIDGLAYQGFFDLPETIGEAANAVRRVTVVLSGSGRTKAVTMVGSPRVPKAELFTSVVAMLADVRYTNRWQRYHDAIGSPDRYEWWIANYKWWSAKPKPEPEQAARRLRSMIIASLDQLPSASRRLAFQELAIVDQLTRQPIVQEEAYFLVGPLGDGDLAREHAHLICGMLARGAHREVLGSAIASVVAVQAYDSQSLVAMIFNGYGRKSIESFISHPDTTVRAAAAEALGTVGPADARAFELLEKRLDDREPVVQAAAAYGLGQLGSQDAIPLLKARLGESERFVKKGILYALGRIGGPRAVEELVAYAMDRDRLVRQSALTALGATGDTSAIYPLMAALHSESSPIGRRIVSEALASLGGDEARAAVLDRLPKEKNPAAKITLIETVAMMEPPTDPDADPGVQALRLLAREQEGDIHEAIVLALARLGDTTAVPSLFGLLTQAENPRALAALRRLTYQHYGKGSARAASERYRQWWQNNRDKSWKWWLLDALAQRGYSPIGLFEAVSGGEDAMNAVPTLIDALTDDRRELRTGVARLLSDLTGQDFGEPDSATDDLGRAVLAARWRSWFESSR